MDSIKYGDIALPGPSSAEPPPPGEPLAADEALLAFLPVREACDVEWRPVLVVGDQAQIGDMLSWADLVRPLLPQIRHLYVLANGSPEARDLPFALLDGQPIAARVGVTFIPRLSWLHPSGRAPGAGGLIVADPEVNLLASAATGRRLAAARPEATHLWREQATRAAVLDALRGGLRWFHFDGHGVLNHDDPWGAHLRLAGESTLTAADILAHRPRIGTVVLSACQSGEAAALSDGESLGLAEAFLLAGTDQVLAAEGTVSDADAARFMERFYAHGGVDDAVAAWQKAVVDLHRADPRPEGGWRRWRMFGRRAVTRSAR